MTAVVFAAISREAGASCVIMPDSCKYVLDADALFEATVASIDVRQSSRGELERAYRLDNVRTWRGHSANVVRSNGDWGHGLELGARYIIQAVSGPPDGLLRVRPCSMTPSVDEAGGFYDFVQSLASPPVGAHLWGRVAARDGDEDGGGYDDGPESAPVEGATVSVVGPVEVTLATKADGTFSLHPLPEGDYTVSVTPPTSRPELKVIEPQSVRLAGPRACADLGFLTFGLIRRPKP